MLSFFIKTPKGRKEIFTVDQKTIDMYKPKPVEDKLAKTEPICFEPKVCNRFLVRLTDKKDKEIVPSFLIKGIDRPMFYYNWWGRRKTKPFKIILYDPIVPSAMQCVMDALNAKKKWNINIKILGPVGDIVEQWDIPNAKLKSTETPLMDWANDGDALLITLTFDIGNYRGVLTS